MLQLYPFIKASELDLSDDKSDVVVSLIQANKWCVIIT